MKKLVSVLILVFAFTLTIQAQKKRKKMHTEKLTSEQQATLAVKKMALELDLTSAQQSKLKPIIEKQIIEKRARHEKMKELRAKKEKIAAETRYKKANETLDKRLAMQEKVKAILTAEQYKKFKKMSKSRKKRKHLKERKEYKKEH